MQPQHPATASWAELPASTCMPHLLRRLMHASLCAAHLEAMAVLARCAGPLAFVGATRLLDSIAVALAGAPAQSLFTPAADSLHNLLHKLLSREEVRTFAYVILTFASAMEARPSGFACENKLPWRHVPALTPGCSQPVACTLHCSGCGMC